MSKDRRKECTSVCLSQTLIHTPGTLPGVNRMKQMKTLKQHKVFSLLTTTNTMLNLFWGNKDGFRLVYLVLFYGCRVKEEHLKR